MKLDTVIFDMDGLLIDSEPLWKEAADQLFLNYGKQLTAAQYAITTGLRTREFLAYWFRHFNFPMNEILIAEKKIVQQVIELVKQKGKPMLGVNHIIKFFIEQMPTLKIFKKYLLKICLIKKKKIRNFNMIC